MSEELKKAVMVEEPRVRPIRLMLLDLQMPLKSGLQVVIEVRKMYADYRK